MTRGIAAPGFAAAAAIPFYKLSLVAAVTHCPFDRVQLAA